MNVEQLAQQAGLKVGTNLSGVRLVGFPLGDTIAHLTLEDLQRFAVIERNEVLEEAAVEFQNFLDLGEEENAKKRSEEALESGDKDQIVRALRHHANVDLYKAAIYRAISAVRAMKTEQQ